MSTNAGNADNTSGLDLPTDSEGWCITRKVQEDKYKFVWKIENFSEEISKPADIMESSESWQRPYQLETASLSKS